MFLLCSIVQHARLVILLFDAAGGLALNRATLHVPSGRYLFAQLAHALMRDQSFRHEMLLAVGALLEYLVRRRLILVHADFAKCLWAWR